MELYKQRMVINEGHLGGYIYEGDVATTFPTLWDFLIEDLNVKSILDVGCGRGFTLKHFYDRGCKVMGIDGSPSAIESNLVKERVRQYDFTRQKIEPQNNFDLVYSVEFVEHVEEQYMENFLSCFDKGKNVVITFAGPDQGGHNHVNCQPKEYWIEKIEKRGFTYDDEYTKILKEKAKHDRMTYCPTFDGNHFEHRGLFFKR